MSNKTLINWQTTFKSGHYPSAFRPGAMKGAYTVAREQGYPYFTWGGRVYTTTDDYPADTGVLEEDLQEAGETLTKFQTLTKRVKDHKSLREMKDLSESLLEQGDITKLQQLDTMIGDWIDEIKPLGDEEIDSTKSIA